MDELSNLKKDLRAFASTAKAKILAGFFKTGKGEYGEGDIFLGVVVPDSRKIAKKYLFLPLTLIQKLLDSKIHEERLVALLIMVQKYERGSEAKREKLVNFYLKSTKRVNNWDLVDLTAPKILGTHLVGRGRSILYKLAKSKNVWERRIAIISTFQFILNGECADTFRIAEILLKDKHDLIQKAVGWMLREVGKRVSREKEEEFLKRNYKKMSRIALRYAIERFPEDKRKRYLRLTR